MEATLGMADAAEGQSSPVENESAGDKNLKQGPACLPRVSQQGQSWAVCPDSRWHFVAQALPGDEIMAWQVPYGLDTHAEFCYHQATCPVVVWRRLMHLSRAGQGRAHVVLQANRNAKTKHQHFHLFLPLHSPKCELRSSHQPTD